MNKDYKNYNSYENDKKVITEDFKKYLVYVKSELDKNDIKPDGFITVERIADWRNQITPEFENCDDLEIIIKELNKVRNEAYDNGSLNFEDFLHEPMNDNN